MADSSAGVHKLDDLIGEIPQQGDMTFYYATDPAMYFLDGRKLYADGTDWP